MSSGKPTSATFDLTATWYSVDSDGRITYTTVGEMTYRRLFEQAGFDFDAIETLADHKRVMSEVVRRKRQELPEGAKPLRSYRKSGLKYIISSEAVMGFFSFRTDKDEPITAIHSGVDPMYVYLVRPEGGNTPLWGYDGLGAFSNSLPSEHPGTRGGVLDLKLYMAEANADFLASRGIDVSQMDDEALEQLGTRLLEGDAYQDTETGELWSVLYDYQPLIGGHAFLGKFDQIIPEFGKSANDLLDNGRLEAVDIRDLFELPAVLKFSYDPDARYEDLPEATRCPEQGLFDPEALCRDYPSLFVPYGDVAMPSLDRGAMSGPTDDFADLDDDDDDLGDSPGL